MRKSSGVLQFIIFATLLTILLVGLVGCGKQSPTAPATVTKSVVKATYPTGVLRLDLGPRTAPTEPWVQWPPLHHNIPVTLPDGSYGWVCETKPRPYDDHGTTVWTLDHYVILGTSGCPDVPID